MTQLHALTNMEDAFMTGLAKLYNIEDPDDVPLSIDLLKIFNLSADTRASALSELLADAPGNSDALCAEVISSMVAIDNAQKKE